MSMTRIEVAEFIGRIARSISDLDNDVATCPVANFRFPFDAWVAYMERFAAFKQRISDNINPTMWMLHTDDIANEANGMAAELLAYRTAYYTGCGYRNPSSAAINPVAPQMGVIDQAVVNLGTNIDHSIQGMGMIAEQARDQVLAPLADAVPWGKILFGAAVIGGTIWAVKR